MGFPLDLTRISPGPPAPVVHALALEIGYRLDQAGHVRWSVGSAEVDTFDAVGVARLVLSSSDIGSLTWGSQQVLSVTVTGVDGTYQVSVSVWRAVLEATGTVTAGSGSPLARNLDFRVPYRSVRSAYPFVVAANNMGRGVAAVLVSDISNRVTADRLRDLIQLYGQWWRARWQERPGW